jgi:hypothetical protein
MVVRSLIKKAEQGGWLPIFPRWNHYTAGMIGDHLTSVIGDAYLKELPGIDIEAAYPYLRKNAFETPVGPSDYQDGKGRRALGSYLRYGYIPLEDEVPQAFHKTSRCRARWNMPTTISYWPGLPYYILGSPVFSEITIRPPGGNVFTIEAHRNSDRNLYIQSATLNDKPFDRIFLTHKEITKGGVLTLEMGLEANPNWGSTLEALPPIQWSTETHLTRMKRRSIFREPFDLLSTLKSRGKTKMSIMGTSNRVDRQDRIVRAAVMAAIVSPLVAQIAAGFLARLQDFFCPANFLPIYAASFALLAPGFFLIGLAGADAAFKLSGRGLSRSQILLVLAAGGAVLGALYFESMAFAVRWLLADYSPLLSLPGLQLALSLAAALGSSWSVLFRPDETPALSLR